VSVLIPNCFTDPTAGTGDRRRVVRIVDQVAYQTHRTLPNLLRVLPRS
jgi:hypothetical protein